MEELIELNIALLTALHKCHTAMAWEENPSTNLQLTTEETFQVIMEVKKTIAKLANKKG